jgi:hypothetical protein
VVASRVGSGGACVWRKSGARRLVVCWCIWQECGLSRCEDVLKFNLLHK